MAAVLFVAGLTSGVDTTPLFHEEKITTDANDASSVFAADVDGDIDTDVLSASWDDGKIAWYENDGTLDPTFTAHTITRDAKGAISVFAADVDGDVDTDVLAGRWGGNVTWYENKGSTNPTFVTHTITRDVDGVESVFATDVDGDGDTDVLSALEGDDRIAWYENDGSANPSFASHRISANLYDPHSVFATDVDGDGDTDALSASEGGDRIAWYENDGSENPSFAAHTITRNADGARSVYAKDVDGDNDTDVLSASWRDDRIAWYENDGTANPSFAAHTITGNADGANTVFARDLNGDNDTDVLSASWNDNKIAWYENIVPDVVEGSSSLVKAPECASLSEGCPKNTLGYTNESAGGGTDPSSVSLNLGDMANHAQLDCRLNDCSFWVNFDTNITGAALSVEDGENHDIARVSVTEDDGAQEIGTVTAVARVNESQDPSVWLEDVRVPEIPQDVFEPEGPPRSSD